MPSTAVDLKENRWRIRDSNGVIIRTTSVADEVLWSRKRKNWVRTPSFVALRASGANLPQNAFSYEEFYMSRGTIAVAEVVGNAGGKVYTIEGHAAQYATLPQFLLIPYNDLNLKLINRAKGNQWNTPVFFAEAGKTSAMVIARATHLVGMANDLRKGRLGDFMKKFHESAVPPKGSAHFRRFNRNYGRDAGKAVSNAWLEYSYGWLPFMMDVRNAVNTLMDIFDRPSSTVCTVTASIKNPSSYRGPESLVFSDSSLNIYAYGYKRETYNYDFRAKWNFKCRPADLPGKLGLTNPLEVVWELTPFSFVADWFLPIGDYLSALDVPLRFEHVSGSFGFRSEVKTETVLTGSNVGGRPGHSKAIYVKREKMNSIPNMSVLRGLKFSGDLRPRQIASSLALLSQQMSRLDLGRGIVVKRNAIKRR